MRLRSALAVVLGTGMLVLATPAVASAAQGEFRYVYQDEAGHEQLGTLFDPPSRDCINLPHVKNLDRPPADSPRNQTDATATVFTEKDCEGDWFTLRPFTGRATDRLKLRSVVFS